MTALAVFPAVRQDQRAGGPVSASTGPAAVRGSVPATDRSADQPVAGRSEMDQSARAVRSRRPGTIRSWPLLLLAFPAAAEVWSGWVGIAQLTGFGAVPLLPGIWSSLHLDTAVMLPVGVECYAAYALRAWLAGGRAISDRTRRFARWSAICSLVILSFRVSQACDLRCPVVDSVADGTLAA